MSLRTLPVASCTALRKFADPPQQKNHPAYELGHKLEDMNFKGHLSLVILPLLVLAVSPRGDLPVAHITGEGWSELTLADFVNVNGDENTWKEVAGVIQCSGTPVGGARSQKQYTNFEMVLEWKHETFAGNSGVFLWCPESAFTDLPPGSLPRQGIEVQVLDLGYEENWEKNRKGAHSDWFTSHGDVFPVGPSSMTAFTPMIDYTAGDTTYTVGNPKSSRCFPTQRLVRKHNEWNHYYIRAINGEVRLWVNGEEVSGGNECKPATGYLALEAEGAPVAFRNMRIRELP